MYSVKQCKAYMKKNGVKGVSKFNKQQLNTKMLDVSNEKYKTRKNKKQDTTISLVFKLTKNENITNHIMSYIVDTTHYDKLSIIYSKSVINNLLLVQLFRYDVVPERYRYNDDSYAKEIMFDIHNILFKKNPYYDEECFKSNTYIRFKLIKMYCLGDLTEPTFVKESSIYRTVRDFNKY